MKRNKQEKKKSKLKTVAKIAAVGAGVAFVGSKIAAHYNDKPQEKNPLEGKLVTFIPDNRYKENADGVKGYLKVIGEDKIDSTNFYHVFKRALDVLMSAGGLIVLSPIYAGLSLAIKIDDPGPAIFSQKRIGKNKQFFNLHKFRSMKMDTPNNIPTHMMKNPDEYITCVGKFIRKFSLDELPQVWDIFVGNMSVIGPRPALWNQELLISERDKYKVHHIKPGLSGWAQINGRDEIEIEDKARLDGEYVKKESLAMDTQCFIETVKKAAFGKEVVEGGTGTASKVGRHYTDDKSDDELIGNIGFGEVVKVNKDKKIKVLITGANSYIGESFKAYAKKYYPNNFKIKTLDMFNPSWQVFDFSKYDIVFHVAGIAHSETGNATDEVKQKYYKVNTDLAIEVAKLAKKQGVKKFIFMSSMIVYSGVDNIDEYTVPSPANFYGDSKLQADVGLRSMATEKFKVIVLRPPMIYGPHCKGNFPKLVKLAKLLPVFPNIDNKRSMLYIYNLTEFLCQLMLLKKFKRKSVVLIPQNAEYASTKQIVKLSSKVKSLGLLNPFVKLAGFGPKKITDLLDKVFGNSYYASEVSKYKGITYQHTSFSDSVIQSMGD